jgi:hypothetical protein
MKIRLVKIKELENALHPNNIEVGFTKEGTLINEPKVGECFYVGFNWRTSTVQEVIDENTFRTYNSIYKIEKL